MPMIIGWIAIAVSLCVLVYLVSTVDDWGRDWTHNQAKLDESNADSDLHPVLAAASPKEVADHVRAWADSQSRWRVVKTEDQQNEIKIHLTRTTRVMRYVDDIQVTISATEQGSRIDAESKSRLGIGDLGQNPRNLKELVASLRWLKV